MDVDNDAPAVFPLGPTIVTFTATDATGNAGTATAIVTVAFPPIAIDTAVQPDPATTQILDVDGNAVALQPGVPVAFEQVGDQIVLTLPVAPDTGVLASFIDPTTGIEIVGATFTIPVRDADGNIVFRFEGQLEATPVGGRAVVVPGTLRLITAERAVNLTALDPRVAQFAAIANAQLLRLPQNATVTLAIQKELGADTVAGFRNDLAAQALFLNDVAAVFDVTTVNLDNRSQVGAAGEVGEAEITFRVGQAWIQALAVDEAGNFDPALIDQLIFIVRESNTGQRQTLDPTFPIWLNIPLSKSSVFFKPLSICETLAVGMAIITP